MKDRDYFASPGQVKKMKMILMLAFVSLGVAVLLFGPFFPVGYVGSGGEAAGYGHHSLAEVTARGFGWETATVPVGSDAFEGVGPYKALPAMWIAMLYIPILLGIVWLSRQLSELSVQLAFTRPVLAPTG